MVDFLKVLPYLLNEIVLLWMVWRGNVDKSYCASHIQILEDDNLHNYIRYMELIMIISVYMIAWRIVGVSTYWDEENAMPGPNMVYKQLRGKKETKGTFVLIISPFFCYNFWQLLNLLRDSLVTFYFSNFDIITVAYKTYWVYHCILRCSLKY